MISIKQFLKENFEGKNVLRLTLSAEPFAVMITGEKSFEYRKPTKWMIARVFDKQGKPKVFDYVLFVNGYGDDLPFFITSYGGQTVSVENVFDLKFSTGFKMDINKSDLILYLPQVVAFGNVSDAQSGVETYFLGDKWLIQKEGS